MEERRVGERFLDVFFTQPPQPQKTCCHEQGLRPFRKGLRSAANTNKPHLANTNMFLTEFGQLCEVGPEGWGPQGGGPEG